MAQRITNDARADAKHQEEVISQYRDYCSYLHAQLVLLSLQSHRTTTAFEDTERVENEEVAANTVIKTIAPPRRALFSKIVEHERHEQQRLFEAEARKEGGERNRLPDPDEVTRVALTTLLEEAEGRGTADGRGLVPRGKPDDIKWYSVDISALSAAPDAAAYSTGRSEEQDRKKIMQQVGMAVVLLLGVVAWMIIPKGSGNATTRALSPLAGNEVLTPWTIASVEVTQTNGEKATIPLSTTNTVAWPKLPKEAAFGYWYTASFQPTLICVPASRITEIAEINVLSDGIGPDRMYRVTNDIQTGDLEIRACDNEDMTRFAILTETQAAPVQEQQTTIDTPAVSVTVQEFTIIGPGTDPLLPPDQARVSVRVQTPDALPWTDARPTLTLEDGTMLTPSNTIKTEQGSELQYLIPLPSAPIDTMWSMQMASMRQPLRWRTTFDPPLARDAVLRDALDVQAVQAVQGEDSNTVVISLTVINRSKTPLTLTADDFALTANDQPLAKPDLATLREPLKANEQRRISLRAPLSGEQRLTLTVGVVRFQIIPTS